MRGFILTDIEGVAGIASFRRTRTDDEAQKAPAMNQLAREVNACVEGIRSVSPDADLIVWDGHGTGGLRADDVKDASYITDGQPYYDLGDYDAVFFVGQHAMAGTAFAPLAHTYNSRTVAYYRLNEIFIGEFGARALVAGQQGVPTVYLTGDEQAAREAQNFVPSIETTVVKHGTGRESAEHLTSSRACERIRKDAANATQQINEILPFNRINPPYVLEIRYIDPMDDETLAGQANPALVTRIDPRTIRIESEDLDDFPF